MSDINQLVQESVSKQEEYQRFFKSTLKKYNVTSPNQLSGTDKKQFFDDIENGWTKEES